MKLKKHIATAVLAIATCLAFGQDKKSETEFKKTCVALADAFTKKNVAEINKYINPKTGVFIISRPGAMDVFTNEKKLDAKNPFAFPYPYSDTIHLKKYPLKYDSAPKYDCGTEKWNKNGFVADSSTKFNRISDIMGFRIKYEEANYSKEEISKINAAEKINRKIVFTEIAKKHGLVFYLSFLNGKWYLTIVDTVASNCGA